MANGNDFYNLTSSQIAGAPSGGKNLESIIQNIFGALSDAGSFGATEEEKSKSLSDLGFDWATGVNEDPSSSWWQGDETGQFGISSMYSGPSIPGKEPSIYTSTQQSGELGYNLETLLARLEGMYGSEGMFAESTEKKHTGMKNLYEILESMDIGGRAKGYRQDIGDIGSEFKAKYTDLTSQYTDRGGKKGRYSSLMGTGKPKFTTGDYLSQHYGTREKEQELYTGEREELVGDYDRDLMELISQLG